MDSMTGSQYGLASRLWKWLRGCGTYGYWKRRQDAIWDEVKPGDFDESGLPVSIRLTNVRCPDGMEVVETRELGQWVYTLRPKGASR